MGLAAAAAAAAASKGWEARGELVGHDGFKLLGSNEPSQLPSLLSLGSLLVLLLLLLMLTPTPAVVVVVGVGVRSDIRAERPDPLTTRPRVTTATPTCCCMERDLLRRYL